MKTNTVAAPAAEQKKCKNPDCRRLFTPGHYGDRQMVCTGDYVAKCDRCPGAKCKRCAGKGTFKQACQIWYKLFWSQTRKPARGIPLADWTKIWKRAHEEVPHYAVLILVARETGLRKGEILGLMWGDVLDPAGKVKTSIELRGQWDDCRGFIPTKTGASRLAYLTETACKAIDTLQRGKSEDRLFPFWESMVWKWFTGLQRRLEIANPATGRPYRFHDIRHSLGYELVRAGRVDLAKKMLGHKNVNTTMGYAEQGAEELLQDLERVRRPAPAAPAKKPRRKK